MGGVGRQRASNDIGHFDNILENWVWRRGGWSILSVD